MADELQVHSSGKVKENAAAEKELEALRKAEKQDKAKAQSAAKKKTDNAAAKAKKAKTAARKTAAAAFKKNKAVEKQLGDLAAVAGGALLTDLAGKNSTKKQRVTALAVLVVAVAAIAVGLLCFRPQLKHLLGMDAAAPTALAGLLPDSTMGYNKIDFTNAVLGKAQETAKLVVLEQEVAVDSEVSSALANLAVFKKTKQIHSQGTGYYTVDLDGFTAKNVAVDLETRTVTVTIPKAVLDHIAVDPEKTTFEETEHAFLGFGDVKLTQEQQNELDRSVQAAMNEVLDTPEQYDKADEIARLKVRQLFQPVVSAVAEEFMVAVQTT